MVKKLTSLFLTVMMVFCSIVTVSATTNNQANLTVVKEGSTFTVYKVLDAKQSSNVYVYNVNSAFEDFFKTGNKYTFDKTKGIKKDGQVFLPVDQANTNKTNAPTKAVPSAAMAEFTKDLQEYINKNVDKAFTTVDITNNTPTALDKGYYLVLETANNSNNGIVASKAMVVDLVKDMTIYPKDDNGGLTKGVVENGNLVDRNTATVGDNIPYQINATIPTYDSNVTDIEFTFTDEMSKGLAFNKDSLKVKIGDTKFVLGTDYTVDVTGNDKNGTRIVIDITNDAKLLANSGKTITIDYNAKLTENAAISSVEGNTNKVKLVYSNLPGITQNELTDETVTYTFGLNIVKFDQDEQTKYLSGAEFTLFKVVTDESGKTVLGDSIGKGTSDASGNVLFTDIDGKKLGLGEGEYVVRETKAPDGYSLLGVDIKVTINKLNKDGKVLAVITATDLDGNLLEEVTVGNDNLNLTLNVGNYKGISLPETGGTGTQIFMIAGGSLILLALAIYGVYEYTNNKKVKQ